MIPAYHHGVHQAGQAPPIISLQAGQAQVF